MHAASSHVTVTSLKVVRSSRSPGSNSLLHSTPAPTGPQPEAAPIPQDLRVAHLQPQEGAWAWRKVHEY